MALKVKQIWPLKRYARILNRSEYRDARNNQEGDEQWMHVQDVNGNLNLFYLQTEQIILKNNDVVEESISLINSQNSVRATAKGDSILFLCKLEQTSELSGNVNLDTMLNAIKDDSGLPAAYSNCISQLDSSTLQGLVYTCLFDPTFPKFVSDVENVLKSIMDDK